MRKHSENLITPLSSDDVAVSYNWQDSEEAQRFRSFLLRKYKAEFRGRGKNLSDEELDNFLKATREEFLSARKMEVEAQQEKANHDA